MEQYEVDPEPDRKGMVHGYSIKTKLLTLWPVKWPLIPNKLFGTLLFLMMEDPVAFQLRVF